MTTSEGIRLELAAALAPRGLELGPVIGRGAMGLVYRAFDARHNRSIAVKVLRPDSPDPAAAARWGREISAVARLRHPNILPLIDSGTTSGGTPYFLMPLAMGATLQTRLADGPLPVAEAVRYAREIAEALACAHGEGLVHRDVKPGNILLESGHAVLADFGLARSLEAGPRQSSQATQAGMVAGTPAYMSPEQWTAETTIDGRSDLFGLGVVLYEMLTGRLPFGARSMPGLIVERLSGRFRAVTPLRPGTPPLLQQVIARALAPDPRDRYDRAESMVADLQQVERQLGAGPRAPVPSFRLRWVAGPAALLGLGLLALALGRFRSTSPRLDPTRVVVADFRNETGDSTLASVGPLAGDLISAGLARIGGLTILNSDLVFGVARRAQDRRVALAPGQGLRALADAARAATVVSGSFYRESGRLEVFAEVIDAPTGRVLLDLGPLVGAASGPDSVLAEARDSVAGFLLRRGRRS